MNENSVPLYRHSYAALYNYSVLFLSGTQRDAHFGSEDMKALLSHFSLTEGSARPNMRLYPNLIIAT